MAENLPNACVKVAASICAQDGVLSEIEERTIFAMLAERFPNFSAEAFENALIEFFDSNKQIEDYLALLDDEEIRKFTLNLAEVSAGSDGLNIRENIALEKAHIVWGMIRDG